MTTITTCERCRELERELAEARQQALVLGQQALAIGLMGERDRLNPNYAYKDRPNCGQCANPDLDYCLVHGAKLGR